MEADNNSQHTQKKPMFDGNLLLNFYGRLSSMKGLQGSTLATENASQLKSNARFRL